MDTASICSIRSAGSCAPGLACLLPRMLLLLQLLLQGRQLALQLRTLGVRLCQFALCWVRQEPIGPAGVEQA